MSTVTEETIGQSNKQHKPLLRKNLIFRCVVYPVTQEEYTAECIDLDIVAMGKTAHEALDELRQAVTGYLDTALKGDPTGLVPRPSPFSHRARYHLFALRAAVGISLSGARRKFLVSDLAFC